MERMKKCYTCKKYVVADRFQKNKRKVDGLEYQCKNCSSTRQKSMYQKHKSDVLKRCKSRYWHDPEKKLFMSRRWYLNNRERHKQLRTAWIEARPGYSAIRSGRRRARVKGNGGNFSLAEWLEIVSKYNCCVCCRATNKRLEADHIIPIVKGGPHSADNIQPLCRSCNRKKYIKVIDYRYAHRTTKIWVLSALYL